MSVFRGVYLTERPRQVSVVVRRLWRGDSMTARKLTARGRHTVLPILGDRLVELRLSVCSAPALVFRAVDDGEAEITIEDGICLRRGDQVRRLEGAKPGASFNSQALAPLLELLGSEVTDALAEQEGRLRVTFSNELVVEVVPSHGYEAWHFRYPRPGRPAGGTREQAVAVTGAHGRLV